MGPRAQLVERLVAWHAQQPDDGADGGAEVEDDIGAAEEAENAFNVTKRGFDAKIGPIEDDLRRLYSAVAVNEDPFLRSEWRSLLEFLDIPHNREPIDSAQDIVQTLLSPAFDDANFYIVYDDRAEPLLRQDAVEVLKTHDMIVCTPDDWLKHVIPDGDDSDLPVPQEIPTGWLAYNALELADYLRKKTRRVIYEYMVTFVYNTGENAAAEDRTYFDDPLLRKTFTTMRTPFTRSLEDIQIRYDAAFKPDRGTSGKISLPDLRKYIEALRKHMDRFDLPDTIDRELLRIADSQRISKELQTKMNLSANIFPPKETTAEVLNYVSLMFTRVTGEELPAVDLDETALVGTFDPDFQPWVNKAGEGFTLGKLSSWPLGETGNDGLQPLGNLPYSSDHAEINDYDQLRLEYNALKTFFDSSRNPPTFCREKWRKATSFGEREAEYQALYEKKDRLMRLYNKSMVKDSPEIKATLKEATSAEIRLNNEFPLDFLRPEPRLMATITKTYKGEKEGYLTVTKGERYKVLRRDLHKEDNPTEKWVELVSKTARGFVPQQNIVDIVDQSQQEQLKWEFFPPSNTSKEALTEQLKALYANATREIVKFQKNVIAGAAKIAEDRFLGAVANKKVNVEFVALDNERDEYAMICRYLDPTNDKVYVGNVATISGVVVYVHAVENLDNNLISIRFSRNYKKPSEPWNYLPMRGDTTPLVIQIGPRIYRDGNDFYDYEGTKLSVNQTRARVKELIEELMIYPLVEMCREFRLQVPDDVDLGRRGDDEPPGDTDAANDMLESGRTRLDEIAHRFEDSASSAESSDSDQGLNSGNDTEAEDEIEHRGEFNYLVKKIEAEWNTETVKTFNFIARDETELSVEEGPRYEVVQQNEGFYVLKNGDLEGIVPASVVDSRSKSYSRRHGLIKMIKKKTRTKPGYWEILADDRTIETMMQTDLDDFVEQMRVAEGERINAEEGGGPKEEELPQDYGDLKEKDVKEQTLRTHIDFMTNKIKREWMTPGKPGSQEKNQDLLEETTRRLQDAEGYREFMVAFQAAVGRDNSPLALDTNGIVDAYYAALEGNIEGDDETDDDEDVADVPEVTTQTHSYGDEILAEVDFLKYAVLQFFGVSAATDDRYHFFTGRDFYDILGVSHDANEKAIEKAYSKQAEKHADKPKDERAQAAKKFKDIAEAFEVLSDKDKRAAFDEYVQIEANRIWAVGPDDDPEKLGAFEDLNIALNLVLSSTGGQPDNWRCLDYLSDQEVLKFGLNTNLKDLWNKQWWAINCKNDLGNAFSDVGSISNMSPEALLEGIDKLMGANFKKEKVKEAMMELIKFTSKLKYLEFALESRLDSVFGGKDHLMENVDYHSWTGTRYFFVRALEDKIFERIIGRPKKWAAFLANRFNLVDLTNVFSQDGSVLIRSIYAVMFGDQSSNFSAPSTKKKLPKIGACWKFEVLPTRADAIEEKLKVRLQNMLPGFKLEPDQGLKRTRGVRGSAYSDRVSQPTRAHAPCNV